MRKNELLPIEIESLSNDGNGVGHIGGMAVFVPFTAVGDRLTVRIEKVLERYAFARTAELLAPSPDRVAPDCPAFGRCGGCAFRHISYEAELAAKQQAVADALRRIGGLDVPVLPILASPVTERYRSKVQFPVAQDEAGLYPGFYAGRSHRVVRIADCCRLQPELLGCIAADTCRLLTERNVTAYNELDGSGTLRHLLLRQSASDGSVLLCLVVNGDALPCAGEAADALMALHPQLRTVVLNYNKTRGNEILSPRCETVRGTGFITDALCGVPVELTALSFLQINHAAAELLYGAVGKAAAVQPGQTLIDLYCGAGTIGLAISKQGSPLYGIETIGDAVRSAQKSAAALGRGDAHFLEGDASLIAQLLSQGVRPDVIVTDPPRKGCAPEVLDAIAASGARRAVMVSCNPATLARDLKYLAAKGFTAGAVQPVDLFPRTAHVEAVCAMARTAD